MARITTEPPNIRAFLDMIAHSEGTSSVPNSDDGYKVIVGGELFDDYFDHPRIMINLPKLGIRSSAAGRYQLLQRFWDVYREQLHLPDFSPISQDKVAIQQLKETHAYDYARDGEIEEAIDRCKNIWASLPGAGYGQHENKLPDLIAAYTRAGGQLG